MRNIMEVLEMAKNGKEDKIYEIQCDNCTLNFKCGNGKVAALLLDKKGKERLSLELINEDGGVFKIEKPIIHNFPLICLPLFVKQFKHLKDHEDFYMLWDAWQTISII